MQMTSMNTKDTRPGNPYKTAKPKDGILWKGMFRPANSKGKFTGEGLTKFHAVLTTDCLWLSSELAIPLKTIRSAELANKSGAVAIVFHNALSRTDEAVGLCMLDFFGFYDRKKVTVFQAALLKAIGSVSQETPLSADSDLSDNSPPEMPTGCEKCGSSQAALVELGTFYCLGFYPFFGAYRWEPRRLYLCRTHALRACTLCNLATALVGNLGFPGFFVAPIRVWKNLSSIRGAFPVSTHIVTLQVLTAILLPLFVVAYVLYRIW
jgi:hypothetical protein